MSGPAESEEEAAPTATVAGAAGAGTAAVAASSASDEPEEAEGAPTGMPEPAPEAPAGRPHKSLLAGAAIAGALLLAVPFLVGGGDDQERTRSAGADAGTVLGSPDEGGYGAIGSASPTARPGPGPA
ncbi:RICIN domain-containing protein, partial [Streptomyces sp. NPDC002491]